MTSRQLNAIAHKENIKMLAAAIGINLDEAASLLDANVLITFDQTSPTDKLLAKQVLELLERTVNSVSFTYSDKIVTIEIVIGNAKPFSSSKVIYVTSGYPIFHISSQPKNTSNQNFELPPVLSQISACYVTGFTLKALSGEQLQYNVPDPFILDLSIFNVTPELISTPIDIETTYLAGAGAIGNAFLWALKYFDVHGKLNIVDDDVVSEGNLNRQIWFWEDDISYPKAERLTTLAQQAFPNLELKPRVSRLETLEERSASAWLPRLVVAVDSRRTRRHLQNEMPGEVFDASTTDISEVIFHYNKQPTDLACLSCIYPQDLDELAHEKHIAEHLGVSVEDIQKHHIDAAAAQIIASKFKNLNMSPETLVGQAYDSLFKALCGQAVLQSKEGRQTLAPFAFVSVLAGSVLAIEFIRRIKNSSPQEFNFWRLSPWHPPQSRLKRTITPISDCEFCSDQILSAVTDKLWAP